MDAIRQKLLHRIGGMDDVVDEILGRIEVDPQTMAYYVSTSFIVTGGIGSGKTYIVNEILKSIDIPYLFVKCASIIQANIGESEQYLQNVFNFSNKHDRCVLVFDDLEVLVPSSSDIVSMGQIRLSTYFFQEVRRRTLRPSQCIIIGIVSQNRLNAINRQILCSDYLSTVISIPKLDKRRRRSILSLILGSLDSNQLDELAAQTASYSVADLCDLCSQYLTNGSESITSLVKLHSASITRHMSSVRPLPGGFNAMIGVSSLIQQVKEAVLSPLLQPEIYAQYDLQPPRGALFHGPSGCGKSMMIEAITEEVGKEVQVMAVVCSDILGKFLGESEKKLHDVFTTAREAAPCILFLDNIEFVGQRRGNDSSEEKTFDRLLSILLTEMDGVMTSPAPIYLIGSTQHIEQLDPALLRPGRMENHIKFELPSVAARQELIHELMKGIVLEDESNRAFLERWLTSRTSQRSQADVRAVIMNGVYEAMRRSHDIKVKQIDFEIGLSQLK